MNLLSLERLSACAIFLCLATLGYFYDWRYQYCNLLQARANALQLQRQMNVMQQDAVHLAQYQSQYNLAKKTLQHVMAVFPNIKKSNANLLTLIKLGETQGVTFVKIKPSPVVNKNFYLQVPVELEIESHHQQFLQFLKQAASTKIIFTCDDWTTRKYSSTKSLVAGDQDLLLFKTTAIFYYLK